MPVGRPVFRGCYYDPHPVSAVEFLHGWITGRISTTVFGDADDPDPWFEPFHDIIQVSIRLTDGDLPYEERLRILRAAFAPTADRGGYSRDGRRQDHFAATDHGWRFTYETAYGRQLRIAFPPTMRNKPAASCWTQSNASPVSRSR